MTSGALTLSGGALAQNYPSRPVKIVVPFPAGGSNDIVARVLAQKLTERNGASFYVENRGGAGGNIGAEAVASSEPDGYTLLLTAPPPLTINTALYKDLRYDPSSGICARRPDRFGADRAGGASVGRDRKREGTGGARQGKAGHAVFWIVGQWFDQSSRRRIAQEHDRHRHRARSLQGRGACDERSRCRPYPNDVRQHPGRAAAGEGQEHQRDCGRRQQAGERPARRADGRGIRCSRLRSLGLVRTGGAGENTGANPCETGRRRRIHPENAGRAETLRRTRRRTRRRFGRGVRKIPR